MCCHKTVVLLSLICVFYIKGIENTYSSLFLYYSMFLEALPTFFVLFGEKVEIVF